MSYNVQINDNLSSSGDKSDVTNLNPEDVAIRVANLNKLYQLYDKPSDRLKQMLAPRLQKLLGQSIKQYYKEFWAIKDISFEVRRGETMGIIGRNGAGKSTLLQILCGTLTPSSGSVQINGRVAALLELGSGFNPEFTGRENVYLNASVLGLTHEQTTARFKDILEFADIGEFIDQPVKAYSSGMMVRLAFAVIAHVDADILVIDEALAVGDAFFTQKCMRFLREFMRGGTVLFVSHDTGSVKSLCDRVLWVEKGQLLREGNPKEICEFYLEAFYEAQHGKSTSTKLKTVNVQVPSSIKTDQRLELINSSSLRNDLRIFMFDPDAQAFGNRGARITDVEFLDKNGNSLSWVVGGELVSLRIVAHASEKLHAPIMGFTVKDRLGQTLFGDNTYLQYLQQEIICKADCEIEAIFQFYMPILPCGSYSVNAAIANGTQLEHVQHHWIHDALIFESQSTSVSTGLIGIPMLDIKLNTKEMFNA